MAKVAVRSVEAEVAPIVRQAVAVPGADPFRSGAVSHDGRYAMVHVQFKAAAAQLTDAQRTAYEQLGKSVHGLRVATGGEVVANQQSNAAEADAGSLPAPYAGENCWSRLEITWTWRATE